MSLRYTKSTNDLATKNSNEKQRRLPNCQRPGLLAGPRALTLSSTTSSRRPFRLRVDHRPGLLRRRKARQVPLHRREGGQIIDNLKLDKI